MINNPGKDLMLDKYLFVDYVINYFRQRAGFCPNLWSSYQDYIDLVLYPAVVRVESAAESPIEKLLALGLLIAAIKDDNIWGVRITESSKNIKETCNYYDKVSWMSERIYEMYGLDGVRDGLDILLDQHVPDSRNDPILKRILQEETTFYTCGAASGKGGRKSIHLTPQVEFNELRIEGKMVRADWVAWIPGSFKKGVVIECDGYGYHSSRTSFSRDRVRSRELQKLGFIVMNFSGSEINKDPVGCGSEIYEYTREYFMDDRTHFYKEVD